MERESFICYKSFVEAGDDLPEADRLKYYDRVLRYAIYGVDKAVEWIAENMFKLVRPQLDANNKRYSDGCKGKEYGGRGWRPKKTPVGISKKTPVGIWSETPNVNEKENENEKEKEKGIETPQTPARLMWFVKQCVQFKDECMELYPNANFRQEVDKCFAWYVSKGIEIEDVHATITSWFLKARSWRSDYGAGIGWPDTEEQWVEEYKRLKGVKFTEKYWAEQARLVRDRKENYEMLGVYIQSG
jgi:hypothetical protein